MKDTSIMGFLINEALFWFTLSGKKILGESDENFEGLTNFFPDILSSDQNFYPIFLSSTETFTPNFILQPKIKSKFLHPELQNWITEFRALNVELQDLFSS